MCVSFMPPILGIPPPVRHPHIAPTDLEGVVILLPVLSQEGGGEGARHHTTMVPHHTGTTCFPNGRPAHSARIGGFAMHIKFAALLAGALLSAGIAAAKPCAKPADVTAFDVAGLKSKLMVTALTCN